MFLITTKNSPASLREMVDGAADLPSRNLPQREEISCDVTSVTQGGALTTDGVRNYDQK